MRGKNAKNYNISEWLKKTSRFCTIHHRLKSS
jgi:hypothetical protein